MGSEYIHGMHAIDDTRRRFITGVAAGTAVLATGLAGCASRANWLTLPAGKAPADLARDESFWREVARYYDRTEGILNLEHGYWGKMARPVQTAYLDDQSALRIYEVAGYVVSAVPSGTQQQIMVDRNKLVRGDNQLI